MPTPQATVAPTPTKPYIQSEHPAPDAPTKPNPSLTAALNKHAGITPAAAPEAKPTPPPASKVDAPSKAADAPAPHVKFITADDAPPAQPTAAPVVATDDKPPATTEAPLDLDKAPPSQLRRFAESAKAESHRIREEMTAIIAERDLTKKELATYRDKLKAADDRAKSLEAAEQRAKELETRYAAADEQLRVTNYVQHPEFHERFVKPLAEAMTSAEELMKELVVDPDGEPRQATAADFQQVLAAPSLTEATRRAKELFGSDLANVVVSQRQAVLRAKSARDEAMKGASLRAQEWQQQQLQREAEARTQARQAFDATAAKLADTYPQLYRPPADDREAQEARQSGEALAKLIVEGKPPDMPQDAYLENFAKVYHRAASFPMRELALHRLQTENESLKAKLAAYEKSTPEGGGRLESSGQSAAPKPNDLDARLHESLARRARSSR